jgi:hypothetical protein
MLAASISTRALKVALFASLLFGLNGRVAVALDSSAALLPRPPADVVDSTKCNIQYGRIHGPLVLLANLLVNHDEMQVSIIVDQFSIKPSPSLDPRSGVLYLQLDDEPGFYPNVELTESQHSFSFIGLKEGRHRIAAAIMNANATISSWQALCFVVS